MRPVPLAALILVGCGIVRHGLIDPAAASAFYIREQSATAMGNAFAGATAAAEDASFLFYNPAAVGRLTGSQVAGNGTLTWPRANFKDGKASTVLGTRVAGTNGGRNAGSVSFIPSLYGVWDTRDTLPTAGNLKLAVAITAPYGLATQYPEGWLGRYHALESTLTTTNIAPSLSYELLDRLWVAAGLQIEYARARQTAAIDFGTIGALNGVPFAVPGTQDGRGRVTGNDWGLGYTLGVLAEPWPGTRLGASFRSAVRHELKGDANFRLDRAGVGAVLRSASGAFAKTDARANFTTPEVVSAGVYHELSEEVAVMAEATWTGWSRFRTQRIRFDNPAQPTDVTAQDWRDTWFGGVGVAYRPDDALILRGGVAYDQAPIPNRTRTPRTPANDGLLVGTGLSYRPFGGVVVDVSYSHFFINSPRIDLKASDPGNAARGNLTGRTENAIDTFSLQATWSF